ncbi:conserved hypothetical protein [Nitrosococcus halophilus Nc 4]|uniref:DUF5658 domain-containing protein n=1 Tax=Nitrosococcus halophilus (strain Nc4) TaxID=472759 RepID=D5C147_NITHN|nr:DUF5658 family protein [Nitrosococcus halophilus]ADE14604.1 conserved hypothetical protein [Nitrosococcus halophilus Nc 4]
MSDTITKKINFHSDRRGRRERRATLIPRFSYWGRRGRRCQIRRQEDLTGIYLDQYPAHLLWITVVILGLCFMDAILTLSLLQRGAVEINPFMATLMNTSTHLFAGVKMAITTLSLVWLVIHHNFMVLDLLRVQALLYGFLFIYLGLVGYESFLLLTEPLFG